ncbi:hypothetical protein M3Y96_00017000 [Aphelenchoides besseyi]|nr:hypothetical protein M3Y96_00017000 [Aphelenchoides besseyi]
MKRQTSSSKRIRTNSNKVDYYSSSHASRQRGQSVIPSRIPESRVVSLDNLVVYENGAENQVKVDLNGQIDVCALEDVNEEATKGPSPKRTRIQPESSGLIDKRINKLFCSSVQCAWKQLFRSK